MVTNIKVRKTKHEVDLSQSIGGRSIILKTFSLFCILVYIHVTVLNSADSHNIMQFGFILLFSRLRSFLSSSLAHVRRKFIHKL